MLLVGPTNPVNTVNRLLVADTATKGIARVSRVRDESTVANTLDDFPNPMRLRVGRMDFYQFGHARIVGEEQARA